jgi:SAM-dependent methyltransferase
VLDVGCGDGRAALALAPPAAMVIGVDPRPAMLDAFADAARTRGLAHTEVLGDWPDIAGQAPFSHVVVCHQVAYDVTDLAGFALELDAHAERRVVLELSHRHPLAWLAPLWAHFWGLERPDGPTAAEAIAVLHEAGLPARLVEWQEPPQPPGTPETPWAQQVALARIRLCLTPDRDEELSWLMATQSPGPRQLVTLWWDPGQDPRQR